MRWGDEIEYIDGAIHRRAGLYLGGAYSLDWEPVKPPWQVQRNTAKECGVSLAGLTTHAVTEVVSFEGWQCMERRDEWNAQRQEGVHTSIQGPLSFPEP